MPQLFPMNWNILTISFLSIMLLSIIFLHFTIFPKTNSMKIMWKPFQKTWKW
uniref:ATP synthase subunit 8 n=1 Tax=Ornithodoros brasiliensis TaxID=888526 RepID=W0FGT6_ORNBR|nr:ATP synthase F0 subunit 8 [Ornithodoros brasiliensis]AHF21681.1 ATP synthase subunit 8 [Ornithodoros brasiliensis]QZP40884.1 ATP synthase F0 subunit 8 [Ornithodoros brasiliensis]